MEAESKRNATMKNWNAKHSSRKNLTRSRLGNLPLVPGFHSFLNNNSRRALGALGNNTAKAARTAHYTNIPPAVGPFPHNAKTTVKTLLNEVMQPKHPGYNINSTALEELIDYLNTYTGTLNLAGKKIGDKGIEKLSELLAQNRTITDLELYSTEMGKEGAKAIAEVLQRNKSITTICLNNNPEIGVDGGIAIGNALTHNSTLTKLEFGGADIGDEGAKAIATALKTNSTLKELVLWGNKITNDGAKVLCNALKENTALSILNIGQDTVQCLEDVGFVQDKHPYGHKLRTFRRNSQPTAPNHHHGGGARRYTCRKKRKPTRL
jgi:hypothetical protein